MMKTVKTAMSMRISDLLRTGCVNLWRRKTRTILTALSMTIGVMCIVVLISIGNQAMDRLIRRRWKPWEV